MENKNVNNTTKQAGNDNKKYRFRLDLHQLSTIF